jgi:hypothetical protein
MNQVCKSVCKCAHYCLSHRVTTNLRFRDHELVDGEPLLEEECPLFWSAKEDEDSTAKH